MNTDTALEYLNSLGMFGIKLGLDNIRTLLHRLDQPQRGYPVIHVGGTNGKGSVSAFIGHIYAECGYRVGVYTSPHLHAFNERISVSGEQISTAEVAALTEKLRQASQGIEPTFFEFTTAMALLHFARCKVDVGVIEVGMGGRLDATNAVDPAVSVITPVSDDHGEYLGSSVSEIAAEKGGIIKPGVPVVLGPQTSEAERVLLTMAHSSNSECYRYNVHYWASDTATSQGEVKISTPAQRWPAMRPGLCGRHQHANLATALMAVEVMQAYGLDADTRAVTKAVAMTRWPGRLEWFAPAGDGRGAGARRGRVLLDGAHNRSGMLALRDYLDDCGITAVHLIVGFKHDKAVAEILPLVLPYTRNMYAVAPAVEQAFPPEEIVRIATAAGSSATSFTQVNVALNHAIKNCAGNEIVVGAGSLFLVAELRNLLKHNPWENLCPDPNI